MTPNRVDEVATGGVLDSGGGTTHFSALVLAEYAASGDYAAQVERFKDAYRSRRDALLAGLEANMPEGASWTHPAGGYFSWIDLPPGTSAEGVRASAITNGMNCTAAGAFYVDPATAPEALRLAFSMYSPADLTEAAARLGATLRTI